MGEKMKSLYIGIDFDGTVVEHKYPEIGTAIDGALDVIEELQEAEHKLILYTMRSGERLVEAVEYLEESGILLFGVNANKSQKHWTESPKIFCNIYIDDAALGCPLLQRTKDGEPVGRPFVDWDEVRDLLVEREVLPK